MAVKAAQAHNECSPAAVAIIRLTSPVGASHVLMAQEHQNTTIREQESFGFRYECIDMSTWPRKERLAKLPQKTLDLSTSLAS
jgi:hypothetical protein